MLLVFYHLIISINLIFTKFAAQHSHTNYRKKDIRPKANVLILIVSLISKTYSASLAGA